MLILLLLLLGTGSLAQDARFRLRLQSPVKVEEGLCIQVPCTVFYPQQGWDDSTPAYGYWFRDRDDVNRDAPVATNNPNRKVQENTRGRFHLLGNPQIQDCSLEIKDAQKSDMGAYFFRLERGPLVKYNFLDNLLYVRVMALTQTSTIHMEGSLKSGQSKNITCTAPWACKGGTPPSYTWIGVALTSLGPETAHSSVLTLTPEPHHHGTSLTCQVIPSGAGVTLESTIQLNVSYAPENLTLHAFQGSSPVPEVLSNATSLQVPEGQSLRLVCEADSNPPAQLSWSRGSLTLSPSQPLNPGVLELPRVVPGDGGEFTCRARHLLGSYEVSLSLVVSGVSSTCPGVSEEQGGTWPLVITLLRGAIMGAGFLLTYAITWIYYIRFRGSQGDKDAKSG
ncbi:sialic acid-binding Ig-like lectin 14 [Echinops telfairi]|uniref:Sialic acid-binding Ig-like lectin 14 n=1 Tax=Echinops telfairi TaxID=9371 RepID=A0ABM1VKL6_ECHTE|nr:sialic acid-binding Ig-like lectin 14 [Echinops telfairi]